MAGADDVREKSAVKNPRIMQNIKKNQYRCQLLPIKDEAYTAAVCIADTDEHFRCEVEEIEE